MKLSNLRMGCDTKWKAMSRTKLPNRFESRPYSSPSTLLGLSTVVLTKLYLWPRGPEGAGIVKPAEFARIQYGEGVHELILLSGERSNRSANRIRQSSIKIIEYLFG